MNDNTKVVMGLIAGVAAGAVLGILLAPEKGSELRDVLTESLNKLGTSIKETATSEIDKLVFSIKEKFTDPINDKLGSAQYEHDDLEHA